MSKLLVFDTETGGFDPQTHSILSVGAVVWENGTISDEIELLIAEADIRADPEALAKNKIDLPKHKQIGLPPADAMARFQTFLTKNFRASSSKERIRLVGHNVYFDIGFLQRLCRLTGTDYESNFSHRVVDTASILRFLNLANRLSLSEASLDAALEYFGIEADPSTRHTALVDARLTAQLLDELIEVVRPSLATAIRDKVATWIAKLRRRK